MRQWGTRSLRVYQTLDPRLQNLCNEILVEYSNISLLYGYRGRVLQNRLFQEKKSKLRFPDSKHNTRPSLAVDIAPWPYPINDNILFGALGFLGGIATVLARRDGLPLVWGGDWNVNGSMVDNTFNDYFHIELRE